jgi:DNA repair protein SbcC/Rad50
MEQLQSARQKVVELLGNVDDVAEAVVRAERMYEGKCYAVAYFDLADNVVGRAGELHDFQERILGDDFFGSPGDLRWNKYLYIVAGPKSRSHDGYENAKAFIESDKEYARKRVVSVEDLEALLGAVQHFKPSTANKDYNVVAEWEKRLAAAGLDELLDRPTRKDVVERIGTKTVKRVPVADKTPTLNPSDKALAQKWLTSISIDKFRPIHDGRSYSFGQVTLIVGPNGTGKTSLLEAIEYFYCGNNRRPGPASTPKISGLLVGNSVPLFATAEAGRIRARCFSWYNRNEQRSNRILDAFTRFNFLDTDAAFRLSTDTETSEIPGDLGRLLVGSDASVIWDYLGKLTPDVETALERAVMRVDDSRQKLEIAQKELEELQSRPSNAKALTEAFRAALDALRCTAPRASTPLATPEEAKGLQDAIVHLQAMLAAGAAAISIDAISARGRELESAIAKARPFEALRKQYAQEVKELAEQAQRSERAVQTLDRWLTYVNSGFSSAHARVTKAKSAADIALSRLGRYAAIDIPEVPEEFATTSLSSALRRANLDVQSATLQLTNLEKMAASFGKAAAARAQAARQLRTAVQATFDAGHPKDDCPICRAKYSTEELAALVEKITGTLEQSSELAEVSEKLVKARQDLEHFQGWVTFFQFLMRVAEAIGLPPDAACIDVPKRLIELRAELANANTELVVADKDWEKLSKLGLSTNEHDLLLNAISGILQSQAAGLDPIAIGNERVKLLDAATEFRKLETENLEQLSRASRQLGEVVSAAIVDGWNTRVQEGGGFQALVVMYSEVTSIQSRANALQDLMDIEGGKALAELSVGMLGAARIHAEAIHAAKFESAAAQSTSTLIEQVERLTGQLNRASEQAKNYRSATEVLSLLLKECTVELATKESLKAIGGQINEIFSRIHAPNEYEYVGEGEVLLQTASMHQKRTLEQVSTGQRAAFALSVFLAMNRSATSAPPVILIDDPIAHIDDLNALSFLDYLRDLAVNSNRQIFFATADTRIASLFSRKFGFLGDSFQTIPLVRKSEAHFSVN